MIRQKVTSWGRDNFRPFPWRTCSEPWKSLIAEVMLQRTRASSVEQVWTDFVSRFPDLESASEADESLFMSVVKPIGLQWRSRLLRDLVRVLADRKRVPEDKNELMSLPGVGEYVASAYLSLHSGKREVIIDANVVRWICRMTGDEYDGETRRRPWLRKVADSLTPARIFRDYNYAVLDFTMTVCGTNPRCESCPVSSHCAYLSAS